MTEDLLFVLEHSTGALALWRDMMQLRLHAQVKKSPSWPRSWANFSFL